MSMRIRIVVVIAAAILGGRGLTPGPIASAQPQAQRARVAGQSATLLPDGRWLLLGGERDGAVVRDAAMLDPRTGAAVPLGASMTAPRADHAATLLPDGTVLVTGGRGPLGQIAGVAELFDPQTGTFLSLPVPGGVPRAGHTATLLMDGRVLMAGGTGADGGIVPEVEIWNLAAQRVETAGVLRHARKGQQAALLGDGTVAFSVGAAAHEVFDPSTGRSADGAARGDDGMPARVALSMPADAAVDVAIDARVALRWSRPLQPETVTPATVTLTGIEGVVDARVVAAEGGRLLFVTPRIPLQHDSAYTLTIAGAADRARQTIPTVSISFVTAGEPRPQADARSDEEAWEPGDRHRRGSWKADRPPSPWESLAPLMAPPGTTAISGRVLTLDGRPLAGVSLEVEGGDAVRSDRTGRFLLTLEAGATARRVLHIDGAPASRGTRRYGFFEYGSTVVAGQTNVLPFTIWMPKLDLAHQVTIPATTTSEVVVTTPFIPGLELHLPPGTTVVGRDGKPVTRVGITAIPVDRPPFPLAKNVDVPVYFTVQPGGAYVKTSGAGPKGAWLVYPNYRQAPAGKRVQFYHYDPDVRNWYVYGLGTVRPDGTQVQPDPKTRIYEFTGAMINSGPSPPPDAPPPGDCNCAKGGDPVDLNTGLFTLEATDLYLQDVLPISITRTYRQRDVESRAFGVGMTHPYAMFLWSALQYQEADLVLPDGARIHYLRTSPGTGWVDAVFAHQETATTTATPTSFYKSVMKWNGHGWDVTLRDGRVYVFGEDAPLQAIRDRYGNQITITHANGQTGNVTQVTSPNGRWIAFTYDVNNRVTQVKDNIGRTVAYTYDAAGNLATVTDPEGDVTSYTYDAAHQMLTVKPPSLQGTSTNLVTNEYTTMADAPTPPGWVKRQTHADGGIFQFAYQVVSGKSVETTVTEPRGTPATPASAQRRVTFNTDGYVLAETRALGQPEEQTTSWNRTGSANFVTSSTDSLQAQTVYVRDTAGNVTTVTRCLPGQSPCTETSPGAVTTRYTYDPRFNDVATVTDPLTHTTTYAYDEAGNLISVTDPLQHQTTLGRDGHGQLTSVTDALQHQTSFVYAGGDLTTITDPLGRVITRFFDAAGRLLRETDPSGQTTRYTYDKNDRVKTVTDGLGAQTSFAYFPGGQLQSVTNPNGHTASYTYDAMDRVATRTDPLLRVDTFTHDLNGKLSVSTDRKGQATARVYDPLNRLHQITYADASAITYTYDDRDRITQIADTAASGPIVRAYDDLDRLTSETTPQGLVTYTYDDAGRRATLTVQGQPTISYTYDAADRLTTLTRDTLGASMAYDDANRRTVLELPNGVVAEYGYDSADQVTGITYRTATQTLGALTYGYDTAGRRTTVGGAWARAGLPPAVSTATYDAADQLTAWAGAARQYDANGSLATDGLTSYAWDSRQRLAGTTGQDLASFTYDAAGRRVAATVAGVSTQYLYDGLNAVAEIQGTQTTSLLAGDDLDEWLARIDSAGSQSFLADGLGSTVALTDSAANVTAQYTYDPFGNTAVQGGTGNSVRFTGREQDGTGTYYYRARYYQPGVGRFMTEDPLGFAGGFNLYQYVDDDPIDNRDPLGQTKGGKRNLGTQLPNGKEINTATPLAEIEAAIAEGIEKNWSKKMMQTLRALRKVVKRGWGPACIIIGIFLDPDPVGGDECPQGPNTCSPRAPTPFTPATPHRRQ